jgi:flagellar biosynthesis protein FlhF
METRTYRVKSIQEALALIRRDLGPEASVLHTRQLSGSLFRWLSGVRQLEVTASTEVQVPSRLPQKSIPGDGSPSSAKLEPESMSSGETSPRIPPAHESDYRTRFRNNLKGKTADAHSLMEDLCRQHDWQTLHELPGTLPRLLRHLIEADISERAARELVTEVRRSAVDLHDLSAVNDEAIRITEKQIRVCGPIHVSPGKTRVAAVIGPTGVGKTTTIAKLAANFRLRDQVRVGLITVDTYRIAAVDQLRTYADIMDLPMEVVATPRDMRKAVERLQGVDLILIDTAGRSPHDEVKVRELKSLLGEAGANEVHLVLSVVADQRRLVSAAERFENIGATSIILTKLDEVDRLGNLLPLLQSCNLPISYTTHGQNVPDDIRPADARQLARRVLKMDLENLIRHP